MPRSKQGAATASTFLRGTAVWVRLSFAGLKVRKSTGVKALPLQLGKDGFLKRTVANYVADNLTILEITERLLKSHAILIGQKLAVTEAAVETEYLRLSAEEQALLTAETKAAEKIARITTRNAMVDIVEVDIVANEIEQLELQLMQKRMKRDDLLRATNQYQETNDKLATWLSNYSYRNGQDTLSANSRRSYSSFIRTVGKYDAEAKIQQVDNIWLTGFQDWMTTTPAERVRRNGRVDVAANPRLNGSVSNYIFKIKSCLNYYFSRADLLPFGIAVNEKYTRHELLLPKAIDSVVTLSEDELLELKALSGLKKKQLRNAQLLLLWLSSTSLRYVDAVTITRANLNEGYITKAVQKGEMYGTVVYIPLNPISLYVLEECNYNLPKIALEDTYAITLMQELCSMLPSMHKKVEIKKFSGRKPIITTNERFKEIGTHSGRRTYINILLDYGVPLHQLMDHTGHTNLKTLQMYRQSRRTMKEHTLNIFNIPRQHNTQV